jgi:hypothetical protein
MANRVNFALTPKANRGSLFFVTPSPQILSLSTIAKKIISQEIIHTIQWYR